MSGQTTPKSLCYMQWLYCSLAAISLSACQPNKEAPAGEKTASSQGSSGKGSSSARPQSVSTFVARLETVPITLNAQGNVIALDEVDVRPQKTGMVQQIHVKEGEEIKRGQLLFSLDDREDQANLQRAQATLSGSEAQRVVAERELARNQDLFTQKFVSAAVVDTSRTKLDGLVSQVQQNKAAIDQLKAVVSYSKIRAPFNGRVGRIDVREGSLVFANAATSLVKITRMDPIGVTFTLTERDLGRLQSAMKNGPVEVDVDVGGRSERGGRGSSNSNGSSAASQSSATTSAVSSKGDTKDKGGDKDKPAKSDGGSPRGKVIFIENSIDKLSGTIAVKAEINNRERKLWPGQYVTTRLNAGEIKDALVIPPQAIVNGPKNRFVYVVQDDATVQQQPIEVVRMSGRFAIVKGIEAGTKVVQEGVGNLRPGSKVQEMADRKGGGKGGDKGADTKGADKDASKPSVDKAPDAPKPDDKASEASADKPSKVRGDAKARESDKSEAKTEAKGAVKPDAKPVAGGITLPPGFTPRDPERWATLDDARKAEIIQRWRERQANGGTQ